MQRIRSLSACLTIVFIMGFTRLALPEDVIAGLDEVVAQLMKEGEVPGLSLAVIQESRIIYSRSYGIKNAETQEPLEQDAVFEAASLSKPVFAYAVMALAQQGKLKLNEPLTHYLKDYIQDKRLDQITAGNVLSHTTGFPNWRPEGKPLEIFFTPGSRFSYSGEGYVYLQKVLEHRMNRSFIEIAKETIFDPLKMTGSSYIWREDYEHRKTNGHDAAGNSKTFWKPAEAIAASSLHTTANDYAKFVIAILQGTTLSRQILGQMLSSQVTPEAGCRQCIDIPFQQGPAKDISWGLGWGLQKIEGETAFWHWGDNNGLFQCYVAAFPARKSGIVIFTNSGNGLSIIPELINVAFHEKHPAFAWIDYEPYNSPLKSFLQDILHRGVEAIADANQAKFSESQINRLGYWLLGKKRIVEAVAVFKNNAANFPVSWNAHDSLGEAYMVHGDLALAAESYRRSLELNRDNANAEAMLKKLREGQ